VVKDLTLFQATKQLFLSLRGKRSRTKRTKFGQREKFAFGTREKWGESKKVENKGVGEGKVGNACPQTPRF